MTPVPLWRGDHPLPHQSRSMGRDLAGEGYAQGQPQTLRVYALTEEDRQRWETPYRFLVQTEQAISHTAFTHAEELLAWCRAYAVTLAPPPAGSRAAFLATPGDPTRWLPLWLPLRAVPEVDATD